MKKNGWVRYSVCQPLTYYAWPFPVPTELRRGIRIISGPELPKDGDAFWRWALSGREMESLNRCPFWVHLGFWDEDVRLSVRQRRAVELVKHTRLAIQIAAPVGCDESTILVSYKNGQNDKGVSTVHQPSMRSTPWGRICGFDSVSLLVIQQVVRNVHLVFASKLLRLINPLYFLELGLESVNEYIGTFLWVSGLDSILMASNPNTFCERLCNVLGEKTYVLPCAGDQPGYRVGDIAKDIYDYRSAIAHGQLIPEKFRQISGFKDTNGVEIGYYPPNALYLHVLHECALFLLTGVLRKILTHQLLPTFSNVTSWKQALKHPF